MPFAGRYKLFYPLPTSHPLQTQWESSTTKDVNPLPVPFSPSADPCRNRGWDSLYEKINEAGLSFHFRSDIGDDAKPGYKKICINAVRNFFDYLKEPSRMEDFEKILDKLSGGSGGYDGVPEKKIIIAPPGEMPDGLSITNLKENFYWNGKPEALFKTLTALKEMNTPPSGAVKHYGVLPLPGEEALWMRAEIETYLERYGPTLTPAQMENLSPEQRKRLLTPVQKARIKEVLNQKDEDAEVPKTLHGIWFKLSKDIPADSLENIAKFLHRMPAWSAFISTDKVNSARGRMEELKATGNPEIASALTRISISSDEDFYKKAPLSNQLKERIRKAIHRELNPASTGSKPNAPAASDFFRLCLLLTQAGMYMDLDTSTPKKLPDKMYAFFGVQIAVIPAPNLKKATDTNQFVMASKNKFAKEILEKVLERMVDAYEKNPDLSRLIRRGPYPDKRNLASLRLDASKDLSMGKRLQSLFKSARSFERTLDKKIMDRKEYDPKTRQIMTLLIGNEVLEVVKELYGEAVLDQCPAAMGLLGKLWQNGHINALSAIAWTGAEQVRVTPKMYSGGANDSSASLASVLQQKQFPDHLEVPRPSIWPERAALSIWRR